MDLYYMTEPIEYFDIHTVEGPTLEGFKVRFTIPSDEEYLKAWLLDPEVFSWFPMTGEAEVDDAAKRWISFYRIKASLTATLNDEPCGIATIYPQVYEQLKHQSELSIIVAPQYRNMQIGTWLMKGLMKLAKERFNISLLHLQVYEGNRAKNLYDKLGFTVFARQSHWIKEEKRYVARIFMEHFLE